VVFDAFGTLVEITDKRRPYVKLVDRLRQTGREPDAECVARLMTAPVALGGVGRALGVEVSSSEIADLELDLYAELASVRLFPDVAPTLSALRARGMRLALCSNLAAPYAVPLKLLLPFQLDAYAWSFEVGAVKPDRAIFQWVCSKLECSPHEVLMVGDTIEADHAGPRAIGMHALHLSREHESTVAESIRTLAELLAVIG
jgi:FMN phosphatase YigB (HAD superfamily)